MKGVSSMPENITWTDPTKNDDPDVKAVFENDNLGNILSWKGSISNSKKYIFSGDDEGIVRLFSFPCPEPEVSLEFLSLISNAMLFIDSFLSCSTCLLRDDNLRVDSFKLDREALRSRKSSSSSKTSMSSPQTVKDSYSFGSFKTQTRLQYRRVHKNRRRHVRRQRNKVV